MPEPGAERHDIEPAESADVISAESGSAQALTHPRSKISSKEIGKLMDAFLAGCPADIAHALRELLNEKKSYFEDPDHFSRFEDRTKRFKSEIHRQISAKLIPNHSIGVLSDVVFLMIVRGTIKDLVWEQSQPEREKLELSGVRTAKLYNLNDALHVKMILHAAANQDELKIQPALDNLLRYATGHALKDFLAKDEYLTIFADEVADCLKDAFSARKDKLAPESASYQKTVELESALSLPQDSDVELQVSRRNLHWLKGGKRAGDCTAPGSMNYWTAGAWNATFENIELESYAYGKFFARFVATVGTSNALPTAWIHAVEFSPLARTFATEKSSFGDAENQKRILESSLAAIQSFVMRSGLNRLLLTTVSNCYGFEDVITPLHGGYGEKAKEPVNSDFTLLSGLNSAHRTIALVPKHTRSSVSSLVSSYLQGWRGSRAFPLTDDDAAANITRPVQQNITVLGGRELQHADVQEAATSLMAQVNLEFEKEQNTLHAIEAKAFQRALAAAVIDKDPGKQLDKLMESLRGTILRLVELCDPGEENRVQKETRVWEKGVRKGFFKLYDRYRTEQEAEKHKAQLFEGRVERALAPMVAAVVRYFRDVGEFPDSGWGETELGHTRMSSRREELLSEISNRVGDIWEFVPDQALLEDRLGGTMADFDDRDIEEVLLEEWAERIALKAKGTFDQSDLGGLLFGMSHDHGSVAEWSPGKRDGTYYAFLRPTAIKRIHTHFDTLLDQLKNSPDIAGAARLAVAERINPGLLNGFSKTLTNTGKPKELADHFVNHAAELLDYYVHVSQQGSSTAGQLTSVIRVHDISPR